MRVSGFGRGVCLKTVGLDFGVCKGLIRVRV